MLLAYCRTSTIEQNLTRQLEAVKEYGVEEENIYIEQASGKDMTNRPKLKELLLYARKDDVIVIDGLDRLSRNYDDIANIIHEIKQKDIKLIVLNMPILNQAIDNPLMDKFMKDLIISVLGMVADMERTEAKRRQAEGIKVAKAKGIYKGKPKEYGPNARNKQKRAIYFRVVEELKNNTPIKSIAKEFDISRNTVYSIKRDLETIPS